MPSITRFHSPAAFDENKEVAGWPPLLELPNVTVTHPKLQQNADLPPDQRQ
jgi:hypothetical protein